MGDLALERGIGKWMVDDRCQGRCSMLIVCAFLARRLTDLHQYIRCAPLGARGWMLRSMGTGMPKSSLHLQNTATVQERNADDRLARRCLLAQCAVFFV